MSLSPSTIVRPLSPVVNCGALDEASDGGRINSFVALRDRFGLAADPPYFFLFDVVLRVEAVLFCDELTLLLVLVTADLSGAGGCFIIDCFSMNLRSGAEEDKLKGF